ncbi:carotenoid 1,2-hydratase [Nitrogeniibacter mangrovi]|uniref:Carotenoid 1,2-hydratase n=1 Tax=Nitrogeniibacter mangrovi TaxID=2016596 RepID=A0A6C1B5N1_9RHOO|nr:lipocalin-like domain-containing protein [Nitrogeniibacter mangrovi]QID18349.1 carotenoid 1,2-hydratase [Nitrogeniibacter mangrovi]
MNVIVLCLLAMLPVAVSAQGIDPYQPLRDPGAGYARVTPGRAFAFPRDHLPHPGYRIEWWYLTANLTDAGGRRWGVQWTLFRQQLAPGADPGGWSSSQMWMAHAALTTPDGYRHEQRFARGGIGQAGVAVRDGRFSAWLDDWSLVADGAELFPARLDATVDGARVRLALSARTPYVLQGEGGYSRKSAQGQASYYYSQPHVRVDGAVTVDGRPVRLSGTGWLDREWSSQPLAANQQGWDWFSLHLADGHALMVYRLRHADGPDWVSGSWIDAEGRSETLGPEDITLDVLERRTVATPTPGQPDATRRLPLAWRVSLPGQDKSWTVRAVRDDQWMGGRFPYWEGVVQVDDGAAGMGYLELTGYAP